MSTQEQDPIEELFYAMDKMPSKNPDGSDLAWRLYVHAATAPIRALQARVKAQQEALNASEEALVWFKAWGDELNKLMGSHPRVGAWDKTLKALAKIKELRGGAN